MKKLATVTTIVLILLVSIGRPTEAAELKVLCAYGMQAVMEELGPRFERSTGHKLQIAFATGGAAVKRAREGELADVVIAPKRGVDDLVKDGKSASGDVSPVANTGISVAIRKGTPKPDISSPDALKRTLLAAKSITYLNPADGGASGVHFAKVLDGLGIASDMKAKTIYAPRTGAVGALVASGDAEIGVIQYQLLYSVPGIDVVGPLPGDLQDTTVFSAAVLAGATNAAAARELISFLRSPEAVAAIRTKGMDPGAP